MDESKFNIFGSDGRIIVWRMSNEELNQVYLSHGFIVNRQTWRWRNNGLETFAASGMENLVFIENNVNHYKHVNIPKESFEMSA